MPGEAGICGRLPRSTLAEPLVHGEEAVPHKPGAAEAAAPTQLREEEPARPWPLAAPWPGPPRLSCSAERDSPRLGSEEAPRVRTLPGFSTGLSRAPGGRPSAPEPSTRASRSRERSPGRTHRPGRQRGSRTAASGLVTAPPAGGVHTRARWRLRRRGQ